MSARLEELKEDHHEDLEHESAGSRAIEMESETDETVKFSLGMKDGTPWEYLLYTPKLLISLQNDAEGWGMSKDGPGTGVSSSVGSSGWLGMIMVWGGKSSR